MMVYLEDMTYIMLNLELGAEHEGLITRVVIFISSLRIL